MNSVVGQRFGMLLVEGEEPGSGSGTMLRVRCDCGCVRRMRRGNVVRAVGNRSCGCARRERMRTLNPKTGMGRHGPTARSWKAMMARCYRPGVNGYKRYGGAGVAVDARWHSYDQFLADMGERPVGTTLDRIDNARGYEPGNCRWATGEQQANNRSTNRQVTAFGRTQTIAQWAREVGLSHRALHGRLKAGWEIERALSTRGGRDARV